MIIERKISKEIRSPRNTVFLATLLCLACLWSYTTPGQTDDAQQEVLAAHEKRRLATLNGDANTIASLKDD